jgi:hypothetical protein
VRAVVGIATVGDKDQIKPLAEFDAKGLFTLEIDRAQLVIPFHTRTRYLTRGIHTTPCRTGRSTSPSIASRTSPQNCPLASVFHFSLQIV